MNGSRYSPLVCLIHPPPHEVREGSFRSQPHFEPLRGLVEHLRKSTNVCICRFSRGSVDGSASNFLRYIFEIGTIKEVWLGENQSLGRGPENNRDSVIALISAHGADVRSLSRIRPLYTRLDLLQCVRSGQVGRANQISGRPPSFCAVRERPPLLWARGEYLACVASTSSQRLDSGLISVRITDRELVWEHNDLARCAILQCLKGPADRS